MSKDNLARKERRQARQKAKAAQKERKRARRQAFELLGSRDFFNEYLAALDRAGVVGEQQNSLVLLIVVVSRVLARPMNVFVKGHSSGGKNWLVTRTLRLLPENAVAEITSASDQSWNYSHGDYRHKVVYVHEQNEAAGTIEPLRILISEGKLVRRVTDFTNGKRRTKEYVTRGPVAAISTTTKNRLQIDDEARHCSIWVDERTEQTREIIKAYTKSHGRLTRSERRAWHMVHRLLKRRGSVKIVFPQWFDQIGDQLFIGDLRVRRYYPAFVEACRTVCLIRSFQRDGEISVNDVLEVDFADFAIAAIIFDPVFVESLHLNRGSSEDTRRLVDEISAKKRRAVEGKDIARALNISMTKAYGKLRYAQQQGIIRQANKPERNNRKAYLANPRPRFVPDPEKLFRKLKSVKGPIRFIHPITGKRVVYRRGK